MLRFSIRDLLWLTLVMGLAVGWWCERRRAETAQVRAAKAAELAARNARLELINAAVTAAWRRTLAETQTESPLSRD